MTESSSLFIPYAAYSNADKSFTEVLIAITFQQQGVAQVSRVDIIRNKGSPKWLSAFVHIDKWYDSSKAVAIRNKIETATDGHLYYAPYKFWMLRRNTSTRLNQIPPPPILKRSGIIC